MQENNFISLRKIIILISGNLYMKLINLIDSYYIVMHFLYQYNIILLLSNSPIV